VPTTALALTVDESRSGVSQVEILMYDFVVGLFVVGLLFVLFRLVRDMIFDNTGTVDSQRDSECGCDEAVDEVIWGSASARRLVRRSATDHATQPASDLDAPPSAALVGARKLPEWVSTTGPFAAPVAVASSILVVVFS
jgi:hypothetical protein